MNRNNIFPFILKTDHETAIRQKDDEISSLRETLKELSQSTNNECTMTDERFNLMKSSLDSLAKRIDSIEHQISNMESTVADLKKLQNNLESKISDILKTPGAVSAIAPAVTEPVISKEGPKSVLADIDLVNDFEAALAKIEEEYGK